MTPGSQGRPSAPRPIITPSAPGPPGMRGPARDVGESPLTTTGIETARFTARIGASPRALVELGPGAAMHRHHRDTGLLGAARELGRIQDDRPSRAASSPSPGRSTAATVARSATARGRLPHQRRAAMAARHLLGRAAHVDVDDRAPRPRPRGARPPPSSAGRSLRAARRGARPRAFRAQPRLVVGPARARRDATISDTTSPAPSRAAMRRNAIGDAGHRRENDGVPRPDLSIRNGRWRRSAKNSLLIK